MKKTSVIILVTIIAVSILLGLGYAAIQNVTLNIAGSAEATPNQSNFKVKFMRDPAPTVSDSTHATANITDDLNATINVSGLTGKGQNVTATYSIENASTDLSADLAVLTTNMEADGYIHITDEVIKNSIQNRKALFDKNGDTHYDNISAFIKSMRGSDPDAVLFYLIYLINF